MKKAVVLCSDYCCKHNGGGGYYGICKHPDNQNKMPYCGIDRYYVSKCCKKEKWEKNV